MILPLCFDNMHFQLQRFKMAPQLTKTWSLKCNVILKNLLSLAGPEIILSTICSTASNEYLHLNAVSLQGILAACWNCGTE